MKVVWSAKAKKDLWKVIDFLYEKWSETQVNRFENLLKNLIENISINKSFCPPSKSLDLRNWIDQNNSLIYLCKNNRIYTVTLIINRSSHPY